MSNQATQQVRRSGMKKRSYQCLKISTELKYKLLGLLRNVKTSKDDC